MDNPCYSCVDYDGAACDWCKRNEYRAHRGIATLKMSTPVFTNYDRLISKTPEELANWAGEYFGCHPAASKEICMGVSNCAVCWLSWLKSPVEVDNGT